MFHRYKNTSQLDWQINIIFTFTSDEKSGIGLDKISKRTTNKNIENNILTIVSILKLKNL